MPKKFRSFGAVECFVALDVVVVLIVLLLLFLMLLLALTTAFSEQPTLSLVSFFSLLIQN